MGTASVVALAIILGATFALRDKRPTPAQPEEPDPITEPAATESAVAPVEPSPRLPAASAVPSTQQKPAEKSAPKQLDETSMLDRLHDLAASDPPESLKLAKEAVARFPDSPNAPEFEWNVVKALANMERFDEAKAEALFMVERYPNSPFSDDVDRHLIHHPPNPPGTP